MIYKAKKFKKNLQNLQKKEKEKFKLKLTIINWQEKDNKKYLKKI